MSRCNRFPHCLSKIQYVHYSAIIYSIKLYDRDNVALCIGYRSFITIIKELSGNERRK